MYSPADRPALRPLEVHPATGVTGGRGIVLVDPLGLAEPTLIPEPMVPFVARCNGDCTIAELQAETARRLGQVADDLVARWVAELDTRLLLQGPAAAAAADRAAAAFLRGPSRPPTHAGSAGYPAEPAALREALAAMLPGPVGPAGLAGPPRGLVAPHLDLARGAAGYRAAYARLWAAPAADLYVVFGTGHGGPAAPVTGLPLDWQTPLGTVPTDRAFVAAVHQRLGPARPEDLLLHRSEHSLELQMLCLQHLHERRGGGPFAVAGFLCGSLPSAAGDPLQEPWCQRLLDAFRRAASARGGRIVYLAGADLAHVGPAFGDRAAVTMARRRRLERDERARLAHLEQGRPGAFHAAVVADGNPDRVCSATAITLTAALAGGPATLLAYGQTSADDDQQTVTYAALAFAG